MAFCHPSGSGIVSSDCWWWWGTCCMVGAGGDTYWGMAWCCWRWWTDGSPCLAMILRGSSQVVVRVLWLQEERGRRKKQKERKNQSRDHKSQLQCRHNQGTSFKLNSRISHLISTSSVTNASNAPKVLWIPELDLDDYQKTWVVWCHKT